MASTLYTNATIITVNHERHVIRDGWILVVGNLIAAIGPTSSINSKLNKPANTKIISLQGKIVIPGLINAHAHLIQSLIRGLAEGMPLHQWACDTIWPMEAAFEAGDGYIAAKLTMAEMLKTGTTCFLEPMLPVQAGLDNISRAVGEVGIRACLGTLVKGPKTHNHLGVADARDKDSALMSVEAAIANHKKYHGNFNDRLHIWMAADTPRGADESGFAAIGDAGLQHGIRVTMHCAEAPRDKTMIREAYKATPLEFCSNTNIVGSHVVLAHLVHIAEDLDIDILQRTGTSVAHNPTSNAKLGDGIAPIPQMLAANINVALGSDGGPCNNAYDLFRDMHLAGLIHCAKAEDPTLLPAEQVLEMATINGARALGLESSLGSLEVGKKADFVVIDPSGLGAAPYDPADTTCSGMHPATVVVHSCSGENVDMVVLDGEIVVEDGVLLRVDEAQIKQSARDASSRLRQSSGVKAQPMKLGWQYI